MTEILTHSAEAPGSMPLYNIKYEIYARERSLGMPITHAAERAGLGKRSGRGSILEQREEVRQRIAWLARQDEEVRHEKFRRLEERQWLIHECDIAKFFEDVEEAVTDKEGNPILDKDGEPVTRIRQWLKPFSALDPELRMCVEGLTWTDSGRPNLKLYNKQDANRELRKMNGLDKASDAAKVSVEMSDDEAIMSLVRSVEVLAGKIAELADAENGDGSE